MVSIRFERERTENRMIPPGKKNQQSEGRSAYEFDANSAKEREVALLAAYMTNAQLTANLWFKSPPPNLRADDCENVEEWVDKLFRANLSRIRRATDPRGSRGYTRGSHLLFRG